MNGGTVSSDLGGLLEETGIVDAYEVGVKSELLDRMLRINVARFYYV